MRLSEIQDSLKIVGINITDDKLNTELKLLGIKPSELDEKTIGVLVEHFQTQNSKPSVTGQGGAIATSTKPVASNQSTPTRSGIAGDRQTVAQDFEALAASANESASRMFRRAKAIVDEETADIEEEMTNEIAKKALAARMATIRGAADFLDIELSDLSFLAPAQKRFQLNGVTDAIEVEATTV